MICKLKLVFNNFLACDRYAQEWCCMDMGMWKRCVQNFKRSWISMDSLLLKISGGTITYQTYYITNCEVVCYVFIWYCTHIFVSAAFKGVSSLEATFGDLRFSCHAHTTLCLWSRSYTAESYLIWMFTYICEDARGDYKARSHYMQLVIRCRYSSDTSSYCLPTNINTVFALYCRASLEYFTTHMDLVQRQKEAVEKKQKVRKGLASDKDWTGEGFVKETETMVSN